MSRLKNVPIIPGIKCVRDINHFSNFTTAYFQTNFEAVLRTIFKIKIRARLDALSQKHHESRWNESWRGSQLPQYVSSWILINYHWLSLNWIYFAEYSYKFLLRQSITQYFVDENGVGWEELSQKQNKSRHDEL